MNTTFELPSNSSSVTKLTVSILLAAAITFALFVAMQKLIANDDLGTSSPKPSPSIDLGWNVKDSPTNERPKLKPKPLPVPTPKPDVQIQQQTPDNNLLVSNYVPQFQLDGLNRSTNNQFTTGDSGLRPLVRMEPKYPAEAARNGIEGWVKLMFSIDVLGQVQNIQIIDAQPSRIFDREAKRALAKWKYKTPVVAGKPQAQDGMMVVLDFKLSQ